MKLVSLILIIYGLTYIICYLNLLTIGYTFINYVNFIIRRKECLIFFIGVIMLFLRKGKK